MDLHPGFTGMVLGSQLSAGTWVLEPHTRLPRQAASTSNTPAAQAFFGARRHGAHLRFFYLAFS